MDSSTILHVPIDPQVKEKAESILKALGLSPSTAINIFYRQIIFQRGLPFEVKLPKHPLDVSQMTAEQLNAKLEKGYEDMLAGRTIPAEQAFADLRDEMFHKISRVSALPEYQLMVQFSEGVTKTYDVRPLFDRIPEFQSLKDPKLFNQVTVDTGGFGVVWNDELDLSCDELWENGSPQISSIEAKMDSE